MSQNLFLTILIIVIAVSCGEVDNNDFSEEVPCSSISGRWTVRRVTCAQRVRKIPTHNLHFQFGGGITSSRGGPDCSKSFLGNVTHTIPNLSIVGNNNFSCSVNNQPVSSCVGADLSCNNTDSAENLTNSFGICVVKELDTLTLLRRATTEDISNGVSYCTNPGEDEEWTLTLAEPEGSFAVLSISDSPFFDFGGVTAVTGRAVREFTVTNSSPVAATAVAPAGLSGSFRFAGGAYPGRDGAITGDCETTIAQGSCTILIEFAPEAILSYEQTLTLFYDDGLRISEATRLFRGQGL